MAIRIRSKLTAKPIDHGRVQAFKKNTTASTFTEMVDILPTILELAEISPEHTHFGKSLVPVLKDSNAEHRDRAFSEGGFAITELDLLEKASGHYAKKADLQHEKPEVIGKSDFYENARSCLCLSSL